jgi:hypothetical protein
VCTSQPVPNDHNRSPVTFTSWSLLRPRLFGYADSLDGRNSHKAQQSGPWPGQEGKMTKRAQAAEAHRHRNTEGRQQASR